MRPSIVEKKQSITALLAIVLGLLLLFMALTQLVEAGGSGGGGGGGGGGGSNISNIRSCGSSCTQYSRGGQTYQTRSADYNRDGDIRDPNEVSTSCVSCDRGGGGGGWQRPPVRPNPGTPGRPGTVTPGPGTPPGSVCTPTACTSAANYCGQTNSGTRACGVGASCSATVPSNTACTNFDIPGTGGGLTATPAVVREGDPVTITYDVGSQNFPSTCTLTGPGITTTTLTVRRGEVTIPTVTGPHQYTLACGSAQVSLTLRVIPTLYES